MLLHLAITMSSIANPHLWLQFGDTNDVYLYLSQKADMAEAKSLSIVNFMMLIEEGTISTDFFM
jgi:hypothetical protein